MEYRPPGALPIKPGVTFFKVIRTPDFWGDIAGTGTIALYQPVDPNALTQDFPSPVPGHRRPHPARYLVPALVAAAVAVALGVYGKIHDPAGTAFNLAGFSSTGAVKSWLATAAFVPVAALESLEMTGSVEPGGPVDTPANAQSVAGSNSGPA